MISIASKKSADSVPTDPNGIVGRPVGTTTEDALELKESRCSALYAKALETQMKGEVAQAIYLYMSLLDGELFREEDTVSGGVEGQEVPKLSSQGLKLKYLALKNLGELEASSGDTSAAIRDLLLAIDIDDTDVMVLGRLGRLALEECYASLAKKVFIRALQLQSNYWPAIEYFALTLFCLGDFELCSEFIATQALQIDENWIYGYLLLYFCQTNTNGTTASFHPTSALKSPSQIAKEAREKIIRCLHDIPVLPTQITAGEVDLLLESITIAQSGSASSQFTSETPPRFFTPNFARSRAHSLNSSPPFAFPQRSLALTLGVIATSGNSSAPSVNLPPTMMHGLSLMSHAMDVDDQCLNVDSSSGGTVDMLVSETALAFLEELVDWSLKLESMREKIASGKVGDMNPIEAAMKPVDRLHLIGGKNRPIMITMTRDRLNLDELISSLYKNVYALSSSTDPNLSLSSGMEFYLDGELLSNELACECLAELDPKQASLATQSSHPKVNHASMGGVATKGHRTAAIAASIGNGGPKRTIAKNRAGSRGANGRNEGHYSEDEADNESSLPSRQSSSIAAMATSHRSSIKGSAESPEIIEEDDDDELQGVSEKETNPLPLTASQRRATPTTTTSSSAAASLAAGASSSVAPKRAKSTNACYLSQEPLISFLGRIVTDLGTENVMVEQIMGEKLLPNDIVSQALDVEALLSASGQQQGNSNVLMNGAKKDDTSRKAFPKPEDEEFHVIWLIHHHLRHKSIADGLKLVAEHIGHCFSHCDWRKNVILRLKKTISLLHTINPSSSLSPDPRVVNMFPVIQSDPKSLTHPDTLPLPYLHLLLGEMAMASDRKELVPSYLLDIQNFVLPLYMSNNETLEPVPLVIDLGNAQRTENMSTDLKFTDLSSQSFPGAKLPLKNCRYFCFDTLSDREVHFYVRCMWLELFYQISDIPSNLANLSPSEEEELAKIDLKAVLYCLKAIKELMKQLEHRRRSSGLRQAFSLSVHQLPPLWRVVDLHSVTEKQTFVHHLQKALGKRATDASSTLPAISANRGSESQSTSSTNVPLPSATVHGPPSLPSAPQTEHLLNSFFDQETRLSTALNNKKYLNALRRTSEMFWKAPSPMVLHCMAHMMNIVHNNWRSILLDVLYQLCQVGVTTLETLARNESQDAYQASLFTDSKTQKQMVLDSALGPASHPASMVSPAVASIVVATLTIFVQATRLDMELVSNQSSQTYTPLRTPHATYLPRLLRLPYTHRLAYNAKLSSFSSEGSSGRTNGSPRHAEGHHFAKDTVEGKELQSLHHKFGITIESLLHDLVAFVIIPISPPHKRKFRSRIAHLHVLIFAVLRLLPDMKVITTSRLLDYLWVAHTDLAGDDICHAGDGVLLQTSIRFVNELEDTYFAILKMGCAEASHASGDPKLASILDIAKEIGLSEMSDSEQGNAPGKVGTTASFDSHMANPATGTSLASPLSHMMPVELALAFGKDLLPSNPSPADTAAIEDLRRSLTLPFAYSTMSSTVCAGDTVSKLRHELLHRCTSCLYNLDLPYPKNISGEYPQWSSSKPHRMSGKACSTFYGNTSTTPATPARPFPTLVQPQNIALAAICASHSPLAGAIQASWMWNEIGPLVPIVPVESAPPPPNQSKESGKKTKSVSGGKPKKTKATNAPKAKRKPKKTASSVSTASEGTHEEEKSTTPSDATVTPSDTQDLLDKNAMEVDFQSSEAQSTQPTSKYVPTLASTRSRRSTVQREIIGAIGEDTSSESSYSTDDSTDSESGSSDGDNAFGYGISGATRRTTGSNRPQVRPADVKRLFLLQHLHSVPGALACPTFDALHTEDMFHLYRYLQPLLLDRTRAKTNSAKLNDVIHRVYLVFGDGPFIDPLELTTSSLELVESHLTEWLEAPNFNFNDWPPGFLSNFVLHPHGNARKRLASMDIDGSSDTKRDEISELLSLAVCLPARHRYAMVYDNICFLKAQARMQEGVTGALKIQILTLLKLQLFARPYHLPALQEYAQQCYSRMFSQIHQGKFADAAIQGPKDTTPADRYFFATIRSLLLAAKVHRKLIVDMPLASKKLSNELLKVVQGKMAIENLDVSCLPYSQLSSRLFSGDDSTFLPNVRKQLILTLWHGGKQFKNGNHKLHVLGTGKAFCEAWTSVDQSIGSPAAFQSGLWIVPFIEGCITEAMLEIQMPKPSSTPHLAHAAWDGPQEQPSDPNKPPAALTIANSVLPVFGPKMVLPSARDLQILPFPQVPTIQSVELWMKAKIREYEVILEQYQLASTPNAGSGTGANVGTVTAAMRGVVAEPKYHLHRARFELLRHLYDPLLSKYLMPALQEALLSLLDPLAPGPNHTFLKATTLAGYFSTSSLNNIFEPTASSNDSPVPSLVSPICLPTDAFYKAVGAEGTDPLVVQRERTLDSILDGWKECCDLKRGGRFYKSHYMLALVLSGIYIRELHEPTAPLMKQIFEQIGCQVPESASCGRLVDRMTALELMSYLVNFRSYLPKRNLWTFVVHLQEEHTDLNRAHHIPALQSKYLNLTLNIMLHLAADHTAAVSHHLLSGTSLIPTAPDPSNAELPIPMDADVSHPAIAPGPHQVTALPTRRSVQTKSQPAFALQPSIKTLLSLITYVSAIVERIATDKTTNMAVVDLTLELAPKVLSAVLLPFFPVLALLSEQMALALAPIPTSSLLDLIKTAAWLWKISTNTHSGNTSYIAYGHTSLTVLMYAFYLYKRIPSPPLTGDIFMLAEAEMPEIAQLILFDLPNPNPYGSPAIFMAEIPSHSHSAHAPSSTQPTQHTPLGASTSKPIAKKA